MKERKPNIVFILNDHQAYYRHGWDGGLKPARPHFDRLAREGVNFERAYTACPLCTPARRSMITGLFPHNHGFLTLEEDENSTIRDQGILYELLADQGYRNYNLVDEPAYHEVATDLRRRLDVWRQATGDPASL